MIVGFVPDEWLDKLRAATQDVVQWSRKYTPEMTRPLGMRSDNDDPLAVRLVFDASYYKTTYSAGDAPIACMYSEACIHTSKDKYMLAAQHRPDHPMVTRLSAPVEGKVHPTYWDFCSQFAADIGMC